MQKINAVHVKSADSCVTVTVPVAKGESVSFHSDGEVESVVAKADVPIYHKLAVSPVKKGGYVYKYGEKIGQALADIEPGDYVHTHNLQKVGFIEGEEAK